MYRKTRPGAHNKENAKRKRGGERTREPLMGPHVYGAINSSDDDPRPSPAMPLPSAARHDDGGCSVNLPSHDWSKSSLVSPNNSWHNARYTFARVFDYPGFKKLLLCSLPGCSSPELPTPLRNALFGGVLGRKCSGLLLIPCEIARV